MGNRSSSETLILGMKVMLHFHKLVQPIAPTTPKVESSSVLRINDNHFLPLEFVVVFDNVVLVWLHIDGFDSMLHPEVHLLIACLCNQLFILCCAVRKDLSEFLACRFQSLFDLLLHKIEGNVVDPRGVKRGWNSESSRIHGHVDEETIDFVHNDNVERTGHKLTLHFRVAKSLCVKHVSENSELEVVVCSEKHLAVEHFSGLEIRADV